MGFFKRVFLGFFGRVFLGGFFWAISVNNLTQCKVDVFKSATDAIDQPKLIPKFNQDPTTRPNPTRPGN